MDESPLFNSNIWIQGRLLTHNIFFPLIGDKIKEMLSNYSTAIFEKKWHYIFELEFLV